MANQTQNQAICLNPQDVISVSENQLHTISTTVAEVFGKQHRDLVRKIKSLECSEQFLTANFCAVKFNHRGNDYDAYEMTKDGFMFLVMGFTGKKAARIKEAYINAFNTMAEQLQQQAAEVKQPVPALADHSDDQCGIKRLMFNNAPVLTLAMVNHLHQLNPQSAQRVYQRERATFAPGDVIKVEDAESLKALRMAGVRTGRAINLLTLAGYRRLVALLYGAGYNVDATRVICDYYGKPAEGRYSEDEIDTLRDAYELMMQWEHSQASDLSEDHRTWLNTRWQKQARHFVSNKRLLKQPASDEVRREIADRLVLEWIKLDHIPDQAVRSPKQMEWMLNAREFNRRFDVVPGKSFLPTRDMAKQAAEFKRLSESHRLIMRLAEIKATLKGEERALELVEWSFNAEQHAKDCGAHIAEDTPGAIAST